MRDYSWKSPVEGAGSHHIEIRTSYPNIRYASVIKGRLACIHSQPGGIVKRMLAYGGFGIAGDDKGCLSDPCYDPGLGFRLVALYFFSKCELIY